MSTWSAFTRDSASIKPRLPRWWLFFEKSFKISAWSRRTCTTFAARYSIAGMWSSRGDAMRDTIGHGTVSAVDWAFQGLGIAVAIVDWNDWSITLENRIFTLWFPGERDASSASLADRLRGFEADRAMARLPQNSRFSFSTVTKVHGSELHI